MNNPAMTARLFLASAAVAASLVWPSLALSQAQPGEDDLRALRYYISQNETDAVSAEIRRLQAAFPGWMPPADLSQVLQTGPTTEVDAIYAHIASGDLAGARQILTDARAKFPKWIPPADMLSRLDLAESQASFDAAIAAGNAQTALRLATATPSLLRCDRINNTWQVAELQAQTGNSAGALVAYRQILAACTNVPDIVATIEKANAVASTDDLSSLIARARQRFPASAATFDALEARMLAGRGIMVPGAKPTNAAAEPQPAVKPAAVTAAPAAVAPTATVAGPAVAPRIATSNLSRLPRSGDGRLGQARAAAKAGNFRECLARSAKPRSLDIVYERAWCAYELERPLEALAGFTAAAGGGLGGTVTRDARFGMALAYLKRNMTDQASGIAASTDLTPEQRRTVESVILDQRGVRAYQQQNYKDAIAFFDAKEIMDGSLRRDLAIMRAYCFLKLGDRIEAQRRFALLDNELSTAETHAGLQASR